MFYSLNVRLFSKGGEAPPRQGDSIPYLLYGGVTKYLTLISEKRTLQALRIT